jgi:sulfonate transport system ATP-binding protein
MSTPSLQVNLRHKAFNGRTIVRDVTFSVNAGEIVAILGASGCGKSTLLRAIAGLDRDFKGDVHVTPTHGQQSVVGVVYQEPRLMPWLNVEQNIAFGLAASGNENPNIDGILQEVMLEDARQYWPKQLSGGMAQRVSIARALIREPDVLLMDEPFSALDVLTRRSLHALTRALTAKHRTATIIVTHDPDEAVNLADRVLVLARTSSEAGATITQDFRPSADADAKHREVEAIIAALENSTDSIAA